MPHSYVYGAAHHGASIQRFLQDDEKVSGSLLGLVHFSDSTSKVLHGLQGAASLQSLVAAVQSDTQTRTQCRVNYSSEPHPLK